MEQVVAPWGHTHKFLPPAHEILMLFYSSIGVGRYETLQANTSDQIFWQAKFRIFARVLPNFARIFALGKYGGGCTVRPLPPPPPPRLIRLYAIWG